MGRGQGESVSNAGVSASARIRSSGNVTRDVPTRRVRYFHVAPLEKREVIASTGLIPGQDGYVYLWSDTDDGREEAESWIGGRDDVWEVDGSGLDVGEWNEVLEGDYSPDEPVAYRFRGIIGPALLTLREDGIWD